MTKTDISAFGGVNAWNSQASSTERGPSIRITAGCSGAIRAVGEVCGGCSYPLEFVFKSAYALLGASGLAANIYIVEADLQDSVFQL